MVREIPKTDSASSATRESMEVPDYGSSPDRISEPGFTSASRPLGDEPIEVENEVKYKEYENDKRMTTDFGAKDSDDTGKAPLDGTREIEPEGEPKASFIDRSKAEK